MKRVLFKQSNLLILLGVLIIALGAGNAWWNWQLSHSPLDTVFDSASELDENRNVLPLLQSEPISVSSDAPFAKFNDPSGFVLPHYLVTGLPALDNTAEKTGLPPDRIVIPALNIDAPVVSIHFIHVVVSGTTYEQWIAPNYFAVGWHDSSALLGLPGNTVLNGHHNAYGKVFQNLININIGDRIIVYSGSQVFEYQVAAKMLLPERYKGIQQRLDNARWINASDDERLTLITCWPADSNTHRVVVVAFPTSVQQNMNQPTGVMTSSIGTSPTKATSSQPTQAAATDEARLGITLNLSASREYYREVGQTITYSYVIKNVTASTLVGPFSIGDDLIHVACPSKNLASGAQITCSGTYQIIQDNLDDGSITNNAVASGAGFISPPASLTVYTLPASGMLLLKSADPLFFDHAGQVITYTYTILNVGNVSLPGPFNVTDDRIKVNCASSVLNPGKSTRCTGTYVVQQADLDAGSITNHARAAMQTLSSNTARVTVFAVPNPGVALTISPDNNSYTNVGQVIHYSYTIRNTGNVTLIGPFTIADDKLTVSCPSGRLVPGDTLTCSASHTITQGDLDAGSVTNRAYARGYYPGGFSIQSGAVQVTLTWQAPPTQEP